jgi:hypothetical protein
MVGSDPQPPRTEPGGGPRGRCCTRPARRSGTARSRAAGVVASRSGTARVGVLLPGLVLLAGCGGTPAPPVGAGEPPVVEALATPAPSSSGEPNLAVGEDGIYLTWIERRSPARHAVRFARWDGREWSEPATVVEREGLFVNWADFPSMAVGPDGALAAHWLQRSGDGPYEYDVRLALSHDGGRTWGEDLVPHRGGVAAEYGFASLFPWRGGFGLVWLDGRETVRGEPMALRFTTLSGGGEPGDEVVLDPSVCDCCQTAVARTDGGLVVAYRGRTEDEVRDIMVVRQVDGAWTPPRPLHRDGWTIAACPVNGPAMAAEGNRVVVAWFTAAGGEGRVLAAVSEDGGASFGDPVRVDEGEGLGRVALTLLPDGDALVVWLEGPGAAGADDGAGIRMRRLGPGGTGPSALIAGSPTSRAAGFPRVARWDDALVFAWTRPGEASQVHAAVARLGGQRNTP